MRVVFCHDLYRGTELRMGQKVVKTMELEHIAGGECHSARVLRSVWLLRFYAVDSYISMGLTSTFPWT